MIENTKELKDTVTSMICTGDDPIELSENDLLNAISIEGEFFLLKLHYDDFEDELISQKIKYKLSQSLSIIVSYEDDGNSLDDIQNYVSYIHELSDNKQNSTFGIKKVAKISKYPITILFSGILPINQLTMTIGKSIFELINSDDSYFKPRFTRFRDDLSKEIGIPILPVFPYFDDELNPYQVRLVDMTDSRLISEFQIQDNLTRDTLEIYLLKLFFIYKVLAEEKKYQN